MTGNYAVRRLPFGAGWYVVDDHGRYIASHPNWADAMCDANRAVAARRLTVRHIATRYLLRPDQPLQIGPPPMLSTMPPVRRILKGSHWADKAIRWGFLAIIGINATILAMNPSWANLTELGMSIAFLWVLTAMHYYHGASQELLERGDRYAIELDKVTADVTAATTLVDQLTADMKRLRDNTPEPRPFMQHTSTIYQ